MSFLARIVNLFTGWGKENVETCVERGAAFLDEKVPDWYLRVNPDTLDVTDCEFCVLGQLYGEYWKGVEALNLGPEDTERMALDGVRDYMSGDVTRLYRAEIYKRRERRGREDRERRAGGGGGGVQYRSPRAARPSAQRALARVVLYTN